MSNQDSYANVLSKVQETVEPEEEPSSDGKRLRQFDSGFRDEVDIKPLKPTLRHWNTNEWGKRPPGATVETHYNHWRDTYMDYILDIYNDYISDAEDLNVSTERIDFDAFCRFVYKNSSGYITPYA